MTTTQAVFFWGLVTQSSIWTATGHHPVLALVWLALAVCTLVVSLIDRRTCGRCGASDLYPWRTRCGNCGARKP